MKSAHAQSVDGRVVRSPRLTTITCVRSIGKEERYGDPVVGRRERPLELDGDKSKLVRSDGSWDREQVKVREEN